VVAGFVRAEAIRERLHAIRYEGYVRDIVALYDAGLTPDVRAVADAADVTDAFAACRAEPVADEREIPRAIAARFPMAHSPTHPPTHPPQRGVHGLLQLERVTVNLESGEILGSAARSALAPRERAVLSVLARHEGRPLTRDELLEAAWPPPAPASRVVDRQIRALRVRLERDPERPRHLITVPARGYMLVV
jgi:hypothetical protein